MAEIQHWIRLNTMFIFKSLITIDKLDNNYIKDKYGTQEHFRNYLNLVEYILFYTFQDDTGLATVMLDTNNFSTLRRYFKKLQEYLTITKKDLMDKIGQKADHCFRWKSTQWDLPTKETYNELINKLDIDIWNGFREYESLRQEYESLRQEYESLRYTFNQKNGLKNIWTYSFRKDKQYKHPTQKPLKLIRDIILNSSNEGDIVLIPFVGTGTDIVACKELKRNYIGIENKLEYVEMARQRVNATPELLFV